MRWIESSIPCGPQFPCWSGRVRRPSTRQPGISTGSIVRFGGRPAWPPFLPRPASRSAAALVDGAPLAAGDGRRSPAALDALWAVQAALSSLDRLEVRGRDSAGLHVLVSGHGLDLTDPSVRTLLGSRTGAPLFGSMAVRTPLGRLSFVYKAAAEIGELGDNTRALRAAIMGDALLHLAVRADTARNVVLAHTRWAR